MKESKQRMLDALNYNHPDRIPVVYHPSNAGLFVHGQKLIDLFNQFPPDNPITFIDLPKPEKDAFDKEGNYHEIKTDEWGTKFSQNILYKVKCIVRLKINNKLFDTTNPILLY